MKVIGYVASVWDKEKVFDGQPSRDCGVTIEGLRLKGSSKLALPEVNREIAAAVLVQWKKRTQKKDDGSDDLYADLHIAGWEYVNKSA